MSNVMTLLLLIVGAVGIYTMALAWKLDLVFDERALLVATLWLGLTLKSINESW